MLFIVPGAGGGVNGPGPVHIHPPGGVGTGVQFETELKS